MGFFGFVKFVNMRWWFPLLKIRFGTNSTTMLDSLIQLINACWDVYNNEKFNPRPDDPNTPQYDPVTFCNFAIDFVATRMGYRKFSGMLANEIHKFVKENKDNEWYPVSNAEDAQLYANQGKFVIACRSGIPHGHVACVVPGSVVYSPGWAMSVPRCLNIGAKNFIGKGVGFAFKEMPEFFVLKMKEA